MESASILSALRSDKLKDSSQWRAWHKRVKAFAVQRTVWDLCNPDTTSHPIPLSEPIEPEYPQSGDQEEKKEWRDLLEVYKIKANRWEKQRKGLNEVNEYIITYLDASLRDVVLEYETPYERLVYLSKRFARSHAYKEEIRMKWRAFATQKPIGDVEKWLISWDEMREQAVSLNLSEAASANNDFLQATKEVLPIWWQAKYQEIGNVSRDRTKCISTGISTIKRVFLYLARPSGSKKEVKNMPFEKRPCPCGNKHPRHHPTTCYILNEAIRPNGYVPKQEAVQRVEKALASDLAWKKWIYEAIEKATPKPSNAIQPLHFGNMAFSSQAIGPAVASLRNRWILDTGSGVHVCNEESRFINLTPCNEMLATGDGKTAVKGRGTVKLTGVDPIRREEKTITLSNACYAPGFHVNLVSYARLREKGGTWSESKGYIQDHEAIPIVSLRLWHHIGLWVFDQPYEAIGTTNAVRSSSTPQHKTASAEMWH
ncbi:hypothetical protein N7499_002931 [Penicillium canescens]|nr:hypothetical protein N7499_002931 [Penicillium canescens]